MGLRIHFKHSIAVGKKGYSITNPDGHVRKKGYSITNPDGHARKYIHGYDISNVTVKNLSINLRAFTWMEKIRTDLQKVKFSGENSLCMYTEKTMFPFPFILNSI